jgi:hypothetical protein
MVIHPITVTVSGPSRPHAPGPKPHLSPPALFALTQRLCWQSRPRCWSCSHPGFESPIHSLRPLSSPSIDRLLSPFLVSPLFRPSFFVSSVSTSRPPFLPSTSRCLVLNVFVAFFRALHYAPRSSSPVTKSSSSPRFPSSQSMFSLAARQFAPVEIS